MHTGSHIVIAGGGLVGLLLACACRQALPHQTSITIIEREFPLERAAAIDTRATALSADSKKRIDAWGLWAGLDAFAAPIKDIHVSRHHRFGSALLSAKEQSLDALGHVVENQAMTAAWLRMAESLGVSIKVGVTIEGLSHADEFPTLQLSDGESLSASLLVMADGAQSPLRQSLKMAVTERPASQFAIATNVAVSAVGDGRAFERFTEQGPIAFLPLPGSDSGGTIYNVIWCAHRARVESLMAFPDEPFLAAMQQTFGWRLGKLMACGVRGSWPLSAVEATEIIRHRCVLMGNAAHTLHPVAGQGFNLSVRDVSALVDTMSGFDFEKNDAHELSNKLHTFARRVESDRTATQSATTMLASIFDTPSALVDAGSPIALSALDMISPLRKRVAELGMGLR